MEEKTISVQVAVPSDRETAFYTSFYTWFAAWRTHEDNADSASPDDGGLDLALKNAARWWRSLTTNERNLWSMLAGASPRPVPERDIIDRLGLPKGAASLRGVLSHPYGKARRAGFAVNWDKIALEDGQTGYRLFIKQEQLDGLGLDLDLAGYADLVRRAQARVQEEEASENEKFGPA